MSDTIAPTANSTRVDYTICTCTDGRHPATQHARPANPVKPSKSIQARYHNGHVVERHVIWTPWKAAS